MLNGRFFAGETAGAFMPGFGPFAVTKRKAPAALGAAHDQGEATAAVAARCVTPHVVLTFKRPPRSANSYVETAGGSDLQ